MFMTDPVALVLGGIALVSIAVAIWLLYHTFTLTIDDAISLDTMDEFRKKMKEFNYLEEIDKGKDNK